MSRRLDATTSGHGPSVHVGQSMTAKVIAVGDAALRAALPMTADALAVRERPARPQVEVRVAQRLEGGHEPRRVILVVLEPATHSAWS